MSTRLEHDLTPEQLQYLTYGVAIAIIPMLYWMYRHIKSLQTRFPDAKVGVTPGKVGKAKTS